MPVAMARASGTPLFWTREDDGQGGERLVFAVRSGRTRGALLALAGLLIAGGAAFAAWLAQGGGLTVAGWIFLVLAPGGAILAGVYILDRLLWARSEYVLGSGMIAARRVSLFGRRETQIPRSAIRAVTQHYTPPPADASSAHEGTWVTFVRWRTAEGDERDFPFDGLHSAAERRWLGPLLAGWAHVPLERAFSSAAEEADPAGLPRDEP